MMLRFSFIVVQILLAGTFIFIPVSRMFGAPTLQQVLDLHIPLWLVWIANVVELGGAALLLLGLRAPICTLLGSALLAASMTGATLAHVRAGNLFSEIPWTLVFLASSLVLIIAYWPKKG